MPERHSAWQAKNMRKAHFIPQGHAKTAIFLESLTGLFVVVAVRHGDDHLEHVGALRAC